MPIRIYALAKELQIDNKKLVDICTRAGITGKGSALASLTDEEVVRLKSFMEGGKGAKGGKAGGGAAARTADPESGRSIRREDYIAPAGTAGTKVPVLPPRQDKPPLLRKKPDETAPLARPAVDVPPQSVAPAAPAVDHPPADKSAPPIAPPKAPSEPTVIPSPLPAVTPAPEVAPGPAGAAASGDLAKSTVPVEAKSPPMPSSPPPAVGPIPPRTPRTQSSSSRPLDRILGKRSQETKPGEKQAGEKKPGEKKPAEKSAPAMHLAPMPTPSKPSKHKPKEPAPQKPDIKLPADAIRAGKAGSKPLSEHLRKHEEKKKRDDLAAKKGPSRGAPPSPARASLHRWNLAGRTDRDARPWWLKKSAKAPGWRL